MVVFSKGCLKLLVVYPVDIRLTCECSDHLLWRNFQFLSRRGGMSPRIERIPILAEQSQPLSGHEYWTITRLETSARLAQPSGWDHNGNSYEMS